MDLSLNINRHYFFYITLHFYITKILSLFSSSTDLTTIKRQIESGVIRNTVDFQKEMLLMISNAMIYNKSDTLVHKMACEMLPDMKEAMEVITS